MAFTQNASDFPLFFHLNSEGREPRLCPQVRSTGGGPCLGLALAPFSFVGFESANTLAAEAAGR